MPFPDVAVAVDLPETAVGLAVPDFLDGVLVGVAERGVEGPHTIGVVIAAWRHVPGGVDDHLLPGVGTPPGNLSLVGRFDPHALLRPASTLTVWIDARETSKLCGGINRARG